MKDTPLVITACVFSRPDVYSQTLESYKTVRGMRDILYMPIFEFGYDPKCLEVLEKAMCSNTGWLVAEPIFNDRRLGVDHNTWNALRLGFEVAETVIHAEDDILWAPDALEFFQWGLNNYKKDRSVFSIGAHNGDGRGGEKVSESLYYSVLREQWFTPWGWATWEDRAGDILSTNPLANQAGWDHTMNHVVRNGRSLVRPHYSRTKHIGITGVHVNGEAWAHDEAGNRDWAGLNPIPANPFYE
jgi:hypothetical protein